MKYTAQNVFEILRAAVQKCEPEGDNHGTWDEATETDKSHFQVLADEFNAAAERGINGLAS